jgi:hypothetical protein
MYGDYAGAKVSSDLMISFEYNGTFTSKKIAENIVKRYKDPTRSITFELSEVINDTAKGTSGWKGQISPFSYANKIVDSVNRITLTNTHLCDNTMDEFMLRLSTFIRSYPEMTTEYTFGVMKETTLSQELANKLTGMSGNVADIRVNGSSITQNGIIIADTTPSSTVQTPAHLITSNGVYTALTNGTVTKVGTANVGSYTYPIKLDAGVPTQVTNELATKLSVDNIINGTTAVGKAEALTSGNKTVDGDLIISNGHTIKFGTSSDGITEKVSPAYIASFNNSTSEGLYWSRVAELPVAWNSVTGKPTVPDLTAWLWTRNSDTEHVIIMADYWGGSSKEFNISFMDIDGEYPFTATPSVVVSPKTSNNDNPQNGWGITSIDNRGMSIKHDSGIITGWYYIAIGY